MLTTEASLPAAPEPCCLCDGRGFDLACEVPPFRIVRCRECGLHATSPRLHAGDLEQFYQGDYWRSERPRDRGYADYVGDADLYRRTFRRRLRHLSDHLPSGARLLEVGSGAGFFLDVARAAGYEPYGVEIAREVAAMAAERHGGRVTVGTIADLPAELPPFQAAVLFDVIEHVEEPPILLREVARRLEPHGWLILETQNVRSCFARVLGPRWHHYKLEHLYHFCPATIRMLLEPHFDTVRITSRDAGKYVSFDFIVERSGRIHPSLPRQLARLRWLSGASCYVNPMDEMLVLARKRAESGDA